MNKKEEKFFNLLIEDGERCRSGGEILWGAVQDPVHREEAWQTIRNLYWRREEEKCQVRYCLERAWEGEQRISAWLLIETMERILRGEEILGRLLAAEEGEIPEEMKTSMELAALGLEELKKIFGYSRTLQQNYMKAEARHQKLVNYEERGNLAVLSGMKALYAGGDAMRAVFWKDGLECSGELLHNILEAASLFQQLTEEHV